MVKDSQLEKMEAPVDVFEETLNKTDTTDFEANRKKSGAAGRPQVRGRDGSYRSTGGPIGGPASSHRAPPKPDERHRAMVGPG
jgi:hypothetical protein